MFVYIAGQQLRIRVRDPKDFSKFLTQDVGTRGRLQRIVGVRDGKYFLQSWHLNLRDYASISDVRRELYNIKGLSSKTVRDGLSMAQEYYALMKTY